MVPPDSAFHSQTRFDEVLAPEIVRASGLPRPSWRSTTIWVAMPAWSVPTCHNVSSPRMRW